MLKKLSLFMVLIMIVTNFSACGGEEPKNQKSEKLSHEEIRYNEAMEYIEDGKYAAALDIIIELDDFKDCEELREKFVFKCSKAIDDICEIVYTYDDKGNQLTYELISNELPWEKSTYVYNDINQCVKEFSEGYNPYVAENTYDSNGNLIFTEYDNNGRTEYQYDANNNCIKEHLYYGEPYSGESIITYVYDENNNCIEMADGLYVTKYFYDEDGTLLKEERDDSRTEYIYDEDGDCIEKLVTTPSYTEVYIYEYDKYGNVIRMDIPHHNVYTVDTTLYEYVLFYDGKLANDYVQPTIAKNDLTVDEILEISREMLHVPDDDSITYDVGEKYYDIGKGLYYIPVNFYKDGKSVAGANVNVKTGELVSNILEYGMYD